MELATRLASDAGERAALLACHAALADVALAQALKALYFDTHSSDPARAAGAAASLQALTQITDEPEVRALASWACGMAALQLEGRVEQSIPLIEAAAAEFDALGQTHTAAETQVSKVYALALVGRYDQAIACGLHARDVFLAHGDVLAAGKIEQNLGNIYHRRDQYDEAAQFYRMAHERFVTVGDQRLVAYAENGLANILTLQHEFRVAAGLYEQALARASGVGAEVTQAEIECNLGCLALFQGHYDRAIHYFEQARRRYMALGMPPRVAATELELAEAYLELNLLAEAVAIYERITPVLTELGMHAEQARATTNHGRACMMLGRRAEAHALLGTARQLYADEGNLVGAAMVLLVEAQLFYSEANYVGAEAAAAQAEEPLTAARRWERSLLARWLRGEANRALGEEVTARAFLETALRDAERQEVPQVAQRCHTSLGLIAMTSGDTIGAEASFQRAMSLIEALRAPLPVEEFRLAFMADKLTPYQALVRLNLADGSPQSIGSALNYVERQRSRTLLELLEKAAVMRTRLRDPLEAENVAQLRQAREDLNWLYSQIRRPPDTDKPDRSLEMGRLQELVRKRETEVANLTRLLEKHGEYLLSTAETLDIAELQGDLGGDSALVEYFGLDGEMLAFVVTNETIEVIRHLASAEEIEAAVVQLSFQIDSLRNGALPLYNRLEELAGRMRYYLRRLYDLLLRPLEGLLDGRRLVVVPHGMLHYVPFHALDDGTGYIIERREVSYAPSASILHHCLAQPQRQLRRALLLGCPDERVVRVENEVRVLAPLFPEAKVLLGEQATLEALYTFAPDADVLHIACHGQFRPDNPLFSSLRLADGSLTARDAYHLDLRCGLVTLSACETGMSEIAPGDELIGLARGFFVAGAPSLLVSLWNVDDDSTAMLMTDFYTRLQAGDRPAAALRHAQRAALKQHAHPFFWSPFLLLGRW